MTVEDSAFRRLVNVMAGQQGLVVEVDGVEPAPLLLSAIGITNATTLRLTVDEGRQLFDAIAEALGTVEYRHATAAIAAGRDTPAGSGPLSSPSARV